MTTVAPSRLPTRPRPLPSQDWTLLMDLHGKPLADVYLSDLNGTFSSPDTVKITASRMDQALQSGALALRRLGHARASIRLSRDFVHGSPKVRTSDFPTEIIIQRGQAWAVCGPVMRLIP